jgi:hypothetical protein
MMVTLESGFSTDLILCPIPMIYSFFFFMTSTNSAGDRPLSKAPENWAAASLRAPPNLGP